MKPKLPRSKAKAKSDFGTGLVQQLLYIGKHLLNKEAEAAILLDKATENIKNGCNLYSELRWLQSANAFSAQWAMIGLRLKPSIRIGKRRKLKPGERKLIVKRLQDQIGWLLSIWFSGVTDHVFGMVASPKCPIALRVDIAKLHKFSHRERYLTHNTIRAYNVFSSLVHKIARRIDKMLGVQSSPGKWQ